jgi:HD superfamily phosphohydrolase YqeK
VDYDHYIIYDNHLQFTNTVALESEKFNIDVNIQDNLNHKLGKPSDLEKGAYFFSLALLKNIKFPEFFVNKLQYIKDHLKQPVFFIDHEHNGKEKASHLFMKKKLVDNLIPKPSGISTLNQFVIKYIYSQKLSAVKKTLHDKNISYDMKDEELVPISTSGFSSGKVSLFNIFLKIRDDRFLKIVHAGEEYDRKALDRLVEKGVLFFYIPLAEHSRYMLFSCQISNALIKNRKNPHEHIRHHLQTAQTTLLNIKHNGVKLDHKTMIQIYSLNLKRVVGEIDQIEADKPIREIFLKMVAGNGLDHSSLCTFWALLLAEKLRMNSPKSSQMIVEAALVHDIGLELLFESVNYSKMPESLDAEGFERYKTHPKIGLDYLSGTKIFDEVVLQAIAQHHEDYRSNRLMSTFSQVIAVADKMAGLMENCKQWHHFEKDIYLFSENFAPNIKEAVIHTLGLDPSIYGQKP